MVFLSQQMYEIEALQKLGLFVVTNVWDKGTRKDSVLCSFGPSFFNEQIYSKNPSTITAIFLQKKKVILFSA
jgi:hypothetical protein